MSRVAVVLTLIAIVVAPLGVVVAPARAQSGTIEIWHWETPPARVEGIEQLFARYEQETGVKVEQVPINFPDYQTKLLSGMATGQLPDIILINPPQLPILMENNAVVPVDDIFQSLDNQFVIPEALSNPYKVDGQQYAIPVFGVYWPMTYRADLYAEAGLEPPKTWDETLAAAEALMLDQDGDGVTDVYGFCLPVSSNGNYGSQVVWSFLRSNGGDIVAVENGEETVVFDSPENIETYTFLAQLAEYSPPGKENLDWGATELLIKSGRCATVMYNGAWIRELAANDPELLEKYAMAPMPAPEGKESRHTGYPRAITVTRTADIDAVAAFLEWLYQPENHADLLNIEAGLFMPVTEATASSDAFLNHPVVAQVADLVTVQAQVGSSIDIIGFTGPEGAPHASQIESSFVLGKVLQRIVLEGESPVAAVAWGAKQYQDIIEN
ncbi:MAG: sugar ABC transporter substrate-binding protein [Anaerolineae bacterium]|nr:sugar ABC transporter substrate-binding protein [Anaerolineae bacterium]